MDFDIENKTCSFCGVRGTQGAKFAGGLGAMMCVPCVEHFHDVFSTEAKTAAVNHPPWEKMSDSEILGELPSSPGTPSRSTSSSPSGWSSLARASPPGPRSARRWASPGKQPGNASRSAWTS